MPVAPDIKAAVLDFDGVLGDTMAQHVQAYQEALAPRGVSVAAESVYEMEGARSETIIAQLADGAGIHLAREEILRLANDKQDAFRNLGTPPLYAGAPALIRGLARGGFRLAVVTGTRRENLVRLLGPLSDLFEILVAQEDYTQDKPHPEPYTRAAELLACAPHHLAALENATRGVASARAAGYAHVLGISTTRPEAILRAAGADPVVADHGAALAAFLQLR